MMVDMDDTETFDLPDAQAWASWLDEHHTTRTSAWVPIAKKGSGGAAVPRADALDVALSYGWIDSQARSVDETHYLQRFSRRRPASSWSKVNVGKAEALIADGRMHEAGLAEVRAAQADGRWTAAYASQREATMSPDLAEALQRNPAGGAGLRPAGSQRAVRGVAARAEGAQPGGTCRPGAPDGGRPGGAVVIDTRAGGPLAWRSTGQAVSAQRPGSVDRAGERPRAGGRAGHLGVRQRGPEPAGT